MCSHVRPIELILIEHEVEAETVYDASNMDVPAGKQQILKPGSFTQFHGEHPRLVTSSESDHM